MKMRKNDLQRFHHRLHGYNRAKLQELLEDLDDALDFPRMERDTTHACRCVDGAPLANENDVFTNDVIREHVHVINFRQQGGATAFPD